ncbi:MAG: phosphatidic acid phosphatase [Oscillospiraceae bacterium]|nr:phosphatidic acid phosphatase [Oscillospiraceae bacterium]MDD4367565.1 phosphatidic acid phosphatase [Oscillospiraceae bacterium]
MVNYRDLRLSNINSERFKHVKLLLFWPLFGLFFFAVERIFPNRNWHYVYVPLDDRIPFCEWFIIPYLFWFVYLIGTLAYTFFFDVPAFKKMMHFVIITYGAAMLIYLFFPTAQALRPQSFSRDNLLTRIVGGLYQFDTNTNVCPSLHVIGSAAALFAGLDTRRFQKWGWKAAYIIAGFLISISTVFLKQHSVIDLLVALPICLIGYAAAYARCRRHSQTPEVAADQD